MATELSVSTAVEETALSRREEHSHELTATREAATAQHEIQSAITVAIRFPRNEDDAFGRLAKSCSRPSFAEKAMYSFPRGNKKVSGASSHLAREAARVWGNIQYGFHIVRDDGKSIHIRGWAWDMQTNSKAIQDAHFQKLVQRKVKVKGQGGERTEWVPPDERDLRELINKHGAIAERNCVLKIIPADLIEDAMQMARDTMNSGASTDIDGARKKIIVAFGEMNISVAELEKYLNHELKLATPEEVTELRTIWRSIKDGNSIWSEYIEPGEKKTETKAGRSPLNDRFAPKVPPEDTEFRHKEPEDVGSETAADDEFTAEFKTRLAAAKAAPEPMIEIGNVEAWAIEPGPDQLPGQTITLVKSLCDLAREEIRGTRAGRDSNKGYQP